ncbi:MAG TPA: hypothetical protein VLV31_10980, partial [Candidatus Acidoferrales bacterium]|nr:hypothetical protein [Candidatus Acidoferrales bacterium]
CDFNNGADFAFCSWCGARIREPDQNAPSTTAQPAPMIAPTGDLRVLIPQPIYARDPRGVFYPTVEWREYKAQ